MTISFRIMNLCILVLLVCGMACGTELSAQQRSKLHPLFRSLVRNTSSRSTRSPRGVNRLATTTSRDGTIRYGAIVYTSNVESIRAAGIHINSVFPGFITAQLLPAEIAQLSSLPVVRYVDPGNIRRPLLDVSVPETGATLLHAGFINNTPYRGSGAIVLVFDTGIDWKHFDFRKAGDTTKSRIKYIWDQTLTANSQEHSPAGLMYGVEYSQAQIEGELNGSARGVVREKDVNGHGTHVTSISAGNGQAYLNKYVGLAPEADIIMVKGGDDNFLEQGEIDALTYAENKARELNEPVVVNMSLGGQVGSHDGTDADEVAIDNFVKAAGRVVCVAAGNDGAHWIHCSGNITPRSSVTTSVIVPKFAPTYVGWDYNYFLVDMWLPDSQAVSLTIKSPNGITYTTPPDSSIDTLKSIDGTIDTWNHTETQNAHRHLQIYIHDHTSILPAHGTWTITLSTTNGTASFDGWLDSELGNSLAGLSNGNTNETIGMPGTSAGAITIGSYTTRSSWWDYLGHHLTSLSTFENTVSNFSSIGPTADGRLKPDISAPGQIITAALSGFATQPSQYIVVNPLYQALQGTSMATPHATGSAALLLSANPTLTAAQIKSLFTSTARSDTYTTGLPNSTWGYGKLDVIASMVKSLSPAAGFSRTILSYDLQGSTSSFALTGNNQIAVRFSPTITGIVTGVQLYLSSSTGQSVEGSGQLVLEVYANANGAPGLKIGSSVSQPLAILSPGALNYIQMLSAHVAVISGSDFFVVLSLSDTTDNIIISTDESNTGTRSLLNTNSTWGMQANNYRVRSIVTSISAAAGVGYVPSLKPLVYRLENNFPNPFNPTTVISYQLPVTSMVHLDIFDILGREVAALVRETKPAGYYEVPWDALKFASGTYFYRLQAGTFSETKKLLLLK